LCSVISPVIVDTGRHQIEAPHSGMLDIRVRKGIADRKSVDWCQLVINARAHSNPALRNPEHLRIRINDRERIRVQSCPVDDRAIVNGGAIDGKKKRRNPAQRTLQAAAIFLQQERRFLRCVRIPGIPDIIAEVVVAGTVEFIRARLGENLDSSQAQLVILGRNRVLVDSDFANRILGGKLTAAESIDKDGIAARPCRRPGQRLEIRAEILRIIG
jgi:hypothetical protein